MRNCTYHLTHPQKRIWYIEQIYPGTALYNIGGPCRIRGAVDLTVLEKAIHAFIAMHPGVRMRIFRQGDEVLQYTADYEYSKLDFFDFRGSADPDQEFRAWVDAAARKPFTLENSSLFYFALFKISEECSGYLIRFHHIIADGWSVNILTEQICSNYMQFIKGSEVDTTPFHSYSEYAALEQEYLASGRFKKNKIFWNEKFAELPAVFLNKSSDCITGKRKTFELPVEFSLKIKEFAGRNRYSLNTFFTALYLLYLNKTTGQDDLVVGTPVLNRSGRKERSIFGMFTSTMPFRFRFDDDSDMGAVLHRVNGELMRCYMNQKYPYDLLVGDLELKKKGYDNLFNVCVNYYNTRLNTEMEGLTLSNAEFFNGSLIYSMQLVIKDWSDTGSLVLDFDYKVHDYTDEQINCMYNILMDLAARVIADPAVKTAGLSLLSGQAAEQLLYGFNAGRAGYPSGQTIHRLFEEQVERTPHRTAVCSGNEELTYAELNARANSLAHLLAAKGVQPETLTGILTVHSTGTVTAILAVLKAGGAYVPIDAGYPAERISYMLDDSGAGILLTNCGLPAGVDYRGEVIDLGNPDLYNGNTANPQSAAGAANLVYVIYTSGSTGRPKGSMIEHRGLVNYIWWAKQMYTGNESEVFPLYSSLAFDLTVTSLFTPLVSGHKIAVYNDDEDEYVLYRIMNENRATVVKLTPSHLALLKNRDNSRSSVRRFIVGGEDLKVSLARDIEKSFGRPVEIYNEYGPTETVVGCMIHKFNAALDNRVSVPVGVPAHNVQIYILDKNLNPVPAGITGEMYISGDGVARGYLNRPELTRERFIANPFIRDARMYKTGDLARFIEGNAPGEYIIEYCGRTDFQVKIRGYRIELGEIEKALLNHPCLKEAVVIDCEDNDQGKFLCAYVVKKGEVSTHELRDYLLQTLPDYMVPLFFVELAAVPLNLSGKVNRDLLPAPARTKAGSPGAWECRTCSEERLAEALKHVLQITGVSPDDNFFHIGGDSIKAIQISSRLKEQGLKIKVKDILSHPRIEEMALCIREDTDLLIDQGMAAGVIKPTPIVSWFFEEDFPDPGHYAQSVLLELKQDIDDGILNAALVRIIKHHDSLRINCNPAAGEIYYNNNRPDEHNILVIHDLSSYPRREQMAVLRQLGEELKAGFCLETGLLFKACLFRLGSAGSFLLLAAHHLVIDGVSWRIILEDIYNLYTALAAGNEPQLPLKTDSFRNWSLALESYAENITDNEKAWWQAAACSGCSLQADYDLGHDALSGCNTVSIQLPETETAQLLTTAHTAYNTKTDDLLITSLVVTLKGFTGGDGIALELEGHGRQAEPDKINIARTVGWFTAVYPVVFSVKSSELPQQIISVKEQLRKIPCNGIGYGVINYSTGFARKEKRRLVRFNYLGSFDEFAGNDLFRISGESSGSDTGRNNHLTCLLDINAVVRSKCLEITLTYSRNKFRDSTIRNFMLQWQTILKSIICHCSGRQQTEFTPSDFNTLDLSQEELDMLFN